MERASNKKGVLLRVIKCLVGGIFAVVALALLGIGYKAAEQVVLVNLLVWAALLTAVYFLVSFLFLGICRLCKAKMVFWDGFLPFGEVLGAVVFTLAIVTDPGQSLFLNILFGVVAGIVAFVQLSFELHRKKKRSDENEPEE